MSHRQKRYGSRMEKSVFFVNLLLNLFLINSGSFEVQINNELVHSKLAGLAFPDYGDVVKNVKLAAEGKPVSKVKEQPITDCIIQ